MTDTYKPEWVPKNDDDKFACRVMCGVNGGLVANVCLQKFNTRLVQIGNVFAVARVRERVVHNYFPVGALAVDVSNKV